MAAPELLAPGAGTEATSPASAAGPLAGPLADRWGAPGRFLAALLMRLIFGGGLLPPLEPPRLDGTRLMGMQFFGLLNHLTELDLASSGLKAVPESLRHLRGLTSLKLQNNRITSGLPHLSGLRALKELDLGQNALSSVDACLGSLSSLTKLNLWANEITELPEDLFLRMTQLETLGLKSNRLRSLPSSIGSLVSLISLFVSDNVLEALPEEIGGLLRLRKLQASHNRLRSLPRAIGRMPSLELMRVACNALAGPEALPAELAQAPALTWFSCAGNPLCPTWPAPPPGVPSPGQSLKNSKSRMRRARGRKPGNGAALEPPAEKGEPAGADSLGGSSAGGIRSPASSKAANSPSASPNTASPSGPGRGSSSGGGSARGAGSPSPVRGPLALLAARTPDSAPLTPPPADPRLSYGGGRAVPADEPVAFDRGGDASMGRFVNIADLEAGLGPGAMETIAPERPPRAAARGGRPARLAEIIMGAPLGEGASGVVKRAVFRGRDLVAKIFKDEVSPDGRAADEIAVALAVDHACITRAVALAEDGPRPVLLMEPAAGSPLADRPDFSSVLACRYAPGAAYSLPAALAVAAGLARALRYLHDRGIAHGDIYAHNLLVAEPGAGGEAATVTLCDFGAAFFYDQHRHSGTFERMEVRAFGILLAELLARVTMPMGGGPDLPPASPARMGSPAPPSPSRESPGPSGGPPAPAASPAPGSSGGTPPPGGSSPARRSIGGPIRVRDKLQRLAAKCRSINPLERPLFWQICRQLELIQAADGQLLGAG